MTDAEASDARADRSTGWHPWLLVLLAVTLVPRAIDDVIATLATSLAAHRPWLFWLPLVSGAIEILGLVVAGILVDRYGIRIVASLSLLAWAAVIASISLFVRDSPILYPVHDGAVFVGLFFGIAVSVAAKLAAPFVRRARFLAILELASTVWLLGVPSIASAAGWPPAPAAASDWPFGGLVIAGAGALLALLWWHARSRDIAPPVLEGGRSPSLLEAVALLRRPGMLALTLVAACHLVMFSTLYRVLPLDVMRLRVLPAEAFQRALIGPLVAFALVKLALAYWSDVRARRTASPAAARVPFVVAGAGLAATVGLIPFVDNAHLGLILWPLAVGMAAFPLVFTLALDVVPAALAGRFLGLAVAIAMAITLAVFVLASLITTRTHDLAWYFYLAGLAGLAAAVLSWTMLRRVQPVEEDSYFAQAIGKVFA